MARFSSPITKSKVTLGLRKAENSQKLIPLLLLGDRGEIGADFQRAHAQPRTAVPHIWAEKFPLADSSAQKHSRCAEGPGGTLIQTPPAAI